MPVKVNYTSAIIKQCFRIARDGTKHILFDPKAIGVAFTKVLYAENEKTAFNLLTKWNKDPHYEYIFINVENIIHDEIPRSAFFHESVHFGKRLDMENQNAS